VPAATSGVKSPVLGRGAIEVVGAATYSARPLPASGLVLAAPKTSWPGERLEPEAGVMMRPAMSKPGVAGFLTMRRPMKASAGL